MHEHRHTLLGVAKQNWRLFLPAWLFPPVFLFGSMAAERFAVGVWFYWLVVMPLFFWSFFRASRPWLLKTAPYFQVVFWAIAVPFLVFVATVALSLAASRLLQE
jgi:hypothetical protein